MILLQKLVVEIIKFFDQNVTNASERAVVEQLKSCSLRNEDFVSPKVKKIPKERALKEALSTMSEAGLKNIRECIWEAYSEIQWNIDSGLFYEKDSGIGQQYLNGNMHTEFIGSKNGAFKSDELRLGLFLLEPNIFYQDHKHEAPELYLNLTKGTEWRFEKTPWQEKDSGSIIYNEPFRVHAIKTNRLPFLSVWCWPKNSVKKCIVVPQCQLNEIDRK